MRARGGALVFAGMGSSYDACYPAVTALAREGVAASMVDTAELLHFRLPMLHTGDDLVLVSQSGESAETVGVARELRRRGDAPTMIAVTNEPASSLAALADHTLGTGAGEETGPSTMTFAAALVVLGALVRSLEGRPHRRGRRRPGARGRGGRGGGRRPPRARDAPRRPRDVARRPRDDGDPRARWCARGRRDGRAHVEGSGRAARRVVAGGAVPPRTTRAGGASTWPRW